MNITTKTFLDGIAFYKDNKELAFYSNITNKIRLFNESKFRDFEFTLEDFEFILKSVKEYIAGIMDHVIGVKITDCIRD